MTISACNILLSQPPVKTSSQNFLSTLPRTGRLLTFSRNPPGRDNCLSRLPLVICSGDISYSCFSIFVCFLPLHHSFSPVPPSPPTCPRRPLSLQKQPLLSGHPLVESRDLSLGSVLDPPSRHDLSHFLPPTSLKTFENAFRFHSPPLSTSSQSQEAPPAISSLPGPPVMTFSHSGPPLAKLSRSPSSDIP